MGSIEFMAEAVAYFSVCGLFYWVSKQWQFVMLPTIGLGLIGSLAVALILPESPRFLLSQKKYDQARTVFQRISQFNLGRGDTKRSSIYRDVESPSFKDILFQEEMDHLSILASN